MVKKTARSRVPNPIVADQLVASRPQAHDDQYRPSRSRPIEPLLVSRIQAATMLGGVSNATLIRLEHSGRLTAVKLSGATGKTFYSAEQVRAVAEGRRS